MTTICVVKDRLLKGSIPEPTSGCLLWLGATAGKGYGVIHLSNPRRNEYVHRLSYAIWVGFIPADKIVHHKCEVFSCIEPTHLELIDQSWHMLQHVNGNKGNVCKNGHFRELYGSFNPLTGKTQCRECIRLSMQKHRARKAVDKVTIVDRAGG